VRIVIPYSAGSVADVFARIVAQNMAVQWNASIIVESKSGANGSIAAEEVARAAPDGYTWLLVTTFFTASPSLYAALRWHPVRDFIAVESALAIPDVQQKLDIAGCQPMSAPLSQFADIIKADVALWAKVVKDAGITAD
jgi:tripartite-type tricarboxylate transporter receptor subunit TctC